jgi:hypothetical protein
VNYKISEVVDYKQKDKIVSISSLADIEFLSEDVLIVHLRKFASKKIIKAIVERCPRLKKVSLSKYAFSRVDGSLGLLPDEVSVLVSRGKGRPSILDKFILYS